MTGQNRISVQFAVAVALVGTLATGVAGCSSGGNDRQVPGCRRVQVQDAEYCVARKGITETGYRCPQDLSRRVEFAGHQVCTKDGEVDPEHRQELRRRIRRMEGADVGVDAGDTSADGADMAGDAASDGGADVGPACTEPETCSVSSGPLPPSYRCHRPVSPPVGEAFQLTIFGQHLAEFSDSKVEVATDTGFKQSIEVDHRCKVTVDLPAFVWGDGGAFAVTLKNSEGEFQFEVVGE